LIKSVMTQQTIHVDDSVFRKNDEEFFDRHQQ
jgi:hypothetical protein